jgi:hypothetical protein
MIDNYRQYDQESTHISPAVQDGQLARHGGLKFHGLSRQVSSFFPKYARRPKPPDAAFGFELNPSIDLRDGNAPTPQHQMVAKPLAII